VADRLLRAGAEVVPLAMNGRLPSFDMPSVGMDTRIVGDV